MSDLKLCEAHTNHIESQLKQVRRGICILEYFSES